MKAKKVKVNVIPVAPEASTKTKKKKPCIALNVGHRSCPCGREGCGNSV